MLVEPPKTPKIHHHVDPMRFPKVQGSYETKAKKSFDPGLLFEGIVKTMVKITKDNK